MQTLTQNLETSLLVTLLILKSNSGQQIALISFGKRDFSTNLILLKHTGELNVTEIYVIIGKLVPLFTE